MQTERQREIIEAAIHLIHHKGIQGLTIKNLAQAIGVTEPAVYRHFENKIQILIAILEVFRGNTANIFEQEQFRQVSALEKITHLFSEHFSTFTANPALASVVFSEEIFKNEPLLLDKIMSVMSGNMAILRDIIQEGQANEEIRNDVPAEHLSWMLMGTLRLYIKNWQLQQHTMNLKSEGKKLIHSLSRILLP